MAVELIAKGGEKKFIFFSFHENHETMKNIVEFGFATSGITQHTEMNKFIVVVVADESFFLSHK